MRCGRLGEVGQDSREERCAVLRVSWEDGLRVLSEIPQHPGSRLLLLDLLSQIDLSFGSILLAPPLFRLIYLLLIAVLMTFRLTGGRWLLHNFIQLVKLLLTPPCLPATTILHSFFLWLYSLLIILLLVVCVLLWPFFFGRPQRRPSDESTGPIQVQLLLLGGM